MGFRFRRSIRILPGVRVNIGTKGVSTSIGVRGASVNVSSRGVRGTAGLPGTGVSYSADITPGRPAAAGQAPVRRARLLLWILLLAAIAIAFLVGSRL